ncbi:hypothetical protein AMTR_s00144p00026340 [Amborella trichopoda]|uniref:Uncharacterized protein n=1 Tax=Amborella trichopoda TaxID=13333 RepID=W1P1B4_AMBTC|nr:hypothetical protein AMTR_s00144p00026340 [Amborella trichopoda]
MAPTLFDANMILRLAVDGDPVICRPISDVCEFIENQLGEVSTRGNLAVIEHSWLKAKFINCHLIVVQVLRYTRAYLFFLINVTILSYSS